MKVQFECPSCLLNRGTHAISKATDSEQLRMQAILEVVNVLCENLSPKVTPSYLGTLRDRAIRKITGNPDPYRLEKEKSNEYALASLPMAIEYVESGKDWREKFKRACLCSAVGNAMEFDISGYSFKYQQFSELLNSAEKSLGIDHRDRLYQLVSESKETLLLTDNAGEIVFDTILVRLIKQLGSHVTVAVKERPVLNDAMIADAQTAGMMDVADYLLTTGNDWVGFNRDESSEEFLDIYSKADLVIAKGMGYLETLTEEPLSDRNAFILKAKCQCVADYLKIERGKYAIMVVESS